MKHIGTRLRSRFSRRFVLQALAITAGIFVAANLLVWLGFRGRTYPNVAVNYHRMGAVRQGDIAERLDKLSLLPETVRLTHKEKSTEMKVAELGIVPDKDNIKRAMAKPSWLPVLNLFGTRNVTVYVGVDKENFAKGLAALAPQFDQDPADAQVVVQNGRFAVQPEREGRMLQADAVRTSLVTALGQSKTAVEVPADIAKPGRTQADLAEPLKQLQAQQNVSITFKYQDKSKKLTPEEIATWYAPKDGSMEPADAKVSAHIGQVATSFGIRAQNQADAVKAAKETLQTQKALDFTFVPMPAVTRTYCVALRGVDASHLPGLEAKLRAVFADARGWGLGGRLILSQVQGGCNFTVWLSAASQMPTFGAICTSDWSCRSGPNVVINFDRWQGASAAWNQNGGSLEDYRTMVINHETGHWFGFHHSNCPGAGQAAPVMQQQSIDLSGCSFNPWPTATELAALRSVFGI